MQETENHQGKSIQATPSYSLYYRLIIACASIAALLCNVIDDPLAHIVTLSLAGGIFLYSIMTYFLSNLNSQNKSIIYLTDGLMVGLVASELSYSPWPSVLLLALLYLDALAQGGIRRWLITNLGAAIGIAVGFLALENQNILYISHYSVHIATTLGAILGLCLYGTVHYRHKHEFETGYQKIAEQLKEQKVRAYEISRYVPKPIRMQIEGNKKTKIERKPITIFFSDIVGFSSLSEELEAETLSEILSSYLGEMSKVVGQYNGTIDKFIGDAIMVTFGDDPLLSKGVKKDAIACVSMALAMGKKMRELQPSWAEMGIKKPLQIRIGINSGYCTVGTFGTSQHMDHTALGVHVNLASRLESAGQPGEILVSHETWNLVKDTILCKDKGKIKAKGFTHPVQVFQVINHRKELGSNQSYFSENTDGFSMHLDMQKVKNYDRAKVLYSLELAAKKLEEKFPQK